VTPEDRSRETQILHMNMIDYWYEVDLKGGLGVAERFYTQDGIFEGGNEPLVGHAAIEAFYAWRVGRGQRTSRHVIANFRAEFHDARNATTHCVMMLYAADGAPVLPSTPPIIITDLIDECVKGEDGAWRYRRRSFVPLFQGGAPATVPPAHLAQTHNKARA
jgi:hypothetical protein